MKGEEKKPVPLITAFKKDTGEQVWVYERSPANGFVKDKSRSGHVSPIRAKINGKDQIVWYSEPLFCGLDPATGKPLWEYTPEKFWDSEDTVSCTPVTDGSIVYGINGITGPLAVEVDANNQAKQLWRTKASDKKNYYGTVLSDAILRDGYLYTFATGNRAGFSGDLRCVELKTGEVKWVEKTYGCGQMVEVDGCLLCLSFAGDLLLIDPKPDAFKLITAWKGGIESDKHWMHHGNIYQKDPAPFWTVPVIAHGRLYIHYSDRLTCYELTAKP